MSYPITVDDLDFPAISDVLRSIPEFDGLPVVTIYRTHLERRDGAAAARERMLQREATVAAILAAREPAQGATLTA